LRDEIPALLNLSHTAGVHVPPLDFRSVEFVILEGHLAAVITASRKSDASTAVSPEKLFRNPASENFAAKIEVELKDVDF